MQWGYRRQHIEAVDRPLATWLAALTGTLVTAGLVEQLGLTGVPNDMRPGATQRWMITELGMKVIEAAADSSSREK
jgi:hypothetical protein